MSEVATAISRHRPSVEKAPDGAFYLLAALQARAWTPGGIAGLVESLICKWAIGPFFYPGQDRGTGGKDQSGRIE